MRTALSWKRKTTFHVFRGFSSVENYVRDSNFKSWRYFFFSPYIEWARVYSLSAHTPTNKSQFFFLSPALTRFLNQLIMRRIYSAEVKVNQSIFPFPFQFKFNCILRHRTHKHNLILSFLCLLAAFHMQPEPHHLHKNDCIFKWISMYWSTLI